jgi:hypothetical protein
VFVSVKEWASQENVSVRAINKRIARHGIPRHAGGKIDPDEAKRIFEAGKDIRQQERGTSTKRRIDTGAPESTDRPAIQTALDAVKLQREKLKLRQLDGSLVDAEEVAGETEARFRADAEALLNWPARVMADIAAELGTDELRTHAVLDKYVRQFMSERSMATVVAEEARQ